MTVPDALRKGCFVTATDTGAGKTHVAVRLIRALRESGACACGFKPICCGDRDDAIALADASDWKGDMDIVNPVWIREPIAPFAAQLRSQQAVDRLAISNAFNALSRNCDCVIVEGAGGWLVPITRDYSMANLAEDLGLPVLIVVENRLGAINHALLTAHAVRDAEVPVAGWILNTIAPCAADLAQETNRGVLDALMPFPRIEI
jgi:dethiobiotin synthetase